ncbi:Fungal transcriptional regulatory protein [Beauveria brongniartii RCEF 3172]|uniref:Fungal transcriptional regulatory protein n=1 Tax=Beauveria brongniartii RCEF 3172 TaxID=1081107 RepID=A0A167B077_9HYPO|nr:Fungal transcriptional regulatory protein [Beauveria brongniartii RCEF 3172]
MTHTTLIPDDFIAKWQSSKIRETKAVRRPTTACQACRASKVRCEGKQRCRRCILRGIACVYHTKPKSKLKSTDSGTNAAVQASTQYAPVPAAAVMGDLPSVTDDQCVTWPPLPALATEKTIQRATEFISSDEGLSLSQNFSGINGQTSFLDAYDLDSMVSQIDGALIAMEASTVCNTYFSGFDVQLNPSGAFDMTQSAAISECGNGGTILPVPKGLGIASRRLSGSFSNTPNGGAFSLGQLHMSEDALEEKSLEDIDRTMKIGKQVASPRHF